METIEEKTFDAVKMVREIRTKVSEETQGMSFEQLKNYIQARLSASKMKPIGK